MHFRKKNETSKQGFLFHRGASHTKWVQTLRSLYENGISKMETFKIDLVMSDLKTLKLPYPTSHIKTSYIVNQASRKMELFERETDSTENLLPKDGIVNYYGKLFTAQEADFYYDRLLHTIEWKNDDANIFGKLIVTKRKVAWYGDSAFEYTYSNTTKKALPWTKELQELKHIIEMKTGEHFNSCLLNLYHSGAEGMAWHSDAEKDLQKNGAIGSLSFGAERKFSFKHKEAKETVSLILEHGSLLVMKGTTQTHWLHRLPPTTLITKPRVNLTFRTIVR